MPEELFDIVDENNKPLGFIKPRSQVHKDGDWHRGIQVFVINREGEFLVHLRSPNKDTDPNKWSLTFGGHVSAGGNYDETAVRELEEEVGIKTGIDDLKKGPLRKFASGTDREFEQAYLYHFNGTLGELDFKDNEVVEVKWMRPEDILQELKSHPEQWSASSMGHDEILKDYKKFIQP